MPHLCRHAQQKQFTTGETIPSRVAVFEEIEGSRFPVPFLPLGPNEADHHVSNQMKEPSSWTLAALLCLICAEIRPFPGDMSDDKYPLYRESENKQCLDP